MNDTEKQKKNLWTGLFVGSLAVHFIILLDIAQFGLKTLNIYGSIDDSYVQTHNYIDPNSYLFALRGSWSRTAPWRDMWLIAIIFAVLHVLILTKVQNKQFRASSYVIAVFFALVVWFFTLNYVFGVPFVGL